MLLVLVLKDMDWDCCDKVQTPLAELKVGCVALFVIMPPRKRIDIAVPFR